MLQLEVVLSEKFDEADNSFVIEEIFDLELEHSLLSMSKWESFFEKPFLNKEKKTHEEFIAYVQAMILTPNVPVDIFGKFSEKNFLDVSKYIDSKQSATTIGETPGADGHEVITTEVIYSWLVFNNIPFHPTETWHLNRLLNLVKVCSIKTQPQKKMSRQEIMRRNKELNAQRRAQLGTKG